MEVWKDIQDVLKKSGIKRDIDVCQLNLARKRLSSVPDLSTFHCLRYLWLNNNKIKELSCRSLNCCMTELYLHNNHIKSISGALSHLTCLRVLLLHNNQIRELDDTMHELRRMQQLHTASEGTSPRYRHHVIHCLPSVQVLDRREVKPEERSWCFQAYRAERHHVLQSVAFGRRLTSASRRDNDTSDGSPIVTAPRPLRRHIAKSRVRPEESGEPLNLPASVLKLSMLDWAAVSTSTQRQLGELVQRPPEPKVLTVTLR
ncbi:leucine-rich repeat-containing protein 72 [Myripristis murdjan]|uniref:leucine-rich repeat-containing protein 72 n=1 Tax=Myripristis murdjan TaxID=586833 RepID=UPI001175FFFA|nr:leucine-rich repeat-containing protein 72 [Myripristis murdjan]